MEAFIVRPFGVKNGIDFDEVQKELILPALKRAGIIGHTTGVILEAGNIRQDMFQLLLTSDLVIADISIHNANVFYELGIRHALRAGKTLLIRCSKDEVPFDLKTDRYLSYDQNNLPADIDVLCESLKQTIHSERPDSPVFLMLPELKSQNPEHFLAIPSDFSKEVFLAKNSGHRGKLALLASEARFFSWEVPALRSIGESPYNSKYYDSAKEIWERVRKKKPLDVQANEYLATLYQRLAEKEAKRKPDLAKQLLAKSEQAINSLFTQFENLSRNKRAEAYSLRARNEKAKWKDLWSGLETEKIGKVAIRSPLLQEAYTNYSDGFYEDLNHFYSGVNALGLLKIIIELAERETAVWESKFDTSEEAKNRLAKHKKDFEVLTIVVRKALESERKVLADNDRSDAWINMTFADIALLTRNNPERVAMLYNSAIHSENGLNLEAPLRQLRLYERLGIQPTNVAAALNEFDDVGTVEETEKKVILFTGHMIDGEGRAEPRFPKEREAEIRQKITNEVKKICQEDASSGWIGVSGGACGGDILFLEVCKELGIPRKMDLALPPEKYIVESVQFAGNTWVDRFYGLYEDADTEVSILAETKQLPAWLQAQKGYSFWERNNMWLLYTALVNGGRNLSLIAVWDGKGEDGPGGTKHMIEEVKRRGAKSIVIAV